MLRAVEPASHSVEVVRLAELKPAEWNPRKIEPEARARLVESIDRFGLVQPIVVNADGTVLGGHQRLDVLRERGDEGCEVVRVDLPEHEAKALAAALNSPLAQGQLTDGLESLVDDILREDQALVASLGLDELLAEVSDPELLTTDGPLVQRGKKHSRMNRNDCSSDVVAVGPWLATVARELSQRLADALLEKWPEEREEGATWICETLLAKPGDR